MVFAGLMPVNRNKITPTIPDMFDRSQVGWALNRLGFDVTRTKVPTDYDSLAHAIGSDPEEHVFLPDTCFFTAHEIPDMFWEALLGKHIATYSGTNCSFVALSIARISD